MNNRKHSLQIKKSSIVLFIALLALLIATSGYLYYNHEAELLRESKYQELKTIADLKQSQIEEWVHVRNAEVNVFTKASFFIRQVEQWQKHPENKSNASEIQDRLERFHHELRFENIYLASLQGKICFEAHQEYEDFSPATMKKISDAVRQMKMEFTDFYYCEVHQKIHYDIIAPLIDDANKPIAVVLFRLDPNVYLYPLIQHWPTPSASSETALIRAEQDSVLFLNELRHQENSALRLRIPLSRTNVPAVQAALGRVGLIEGKDYRGVDVLADIRKIPGTPWLMIAKVDQREIFSELSTKAFTVVSVCLLLIVIVILGLVWIYNTRQRTIYMELYTKEKELWQSQEKFKVTIDSLGDGVITTDVNGRINYMNTIAESMTEWNIREARGRHLKEVYVVRNEETGSMETNILEKVFQRGIVKELANHTILLSKAGKEIPVMDTGAPIYDIDNSVIGLVVTFQDETERRHQRRQLKESEYRLRSTLDHMMEGCQIIGHDWRYLYINDIAAQHGRYSKGEFAGKTMMELYPGIETTEMFATLKQCLEEKTNRQMENRFTYPDGTAGWFRLSMQTVPEGILILSEDITGRKNMETQMLRAQRMESLGTLASGIAHDLNNVFSPIALSLEIIKKKIPDAPGQRILQMLESSVKRGSELIKQILTFARGFNGDHRLIQVRYVIEEVEKIMKETFPKSIAISVDIPKDLPPILADATQLHQVLMNICVNARDAMPTGGVLTVKAEAKSLDETFVRANIDAKQGLYVVITLADQGTGIPREIMDKIFEPFFTTKEIGKGTGLGLSTVFSIVKNHGGFVRVESEVSSGTTFSVYLPAQDDNSIVASEEKQSVPLGVGELILVVDDEESIREITKTSLEANGYVVLTARDGVQALALYEQYWNKIDVVLTDMMMPNMDGNIMIQTMKRINPNAKILAVSGLKQEGDGQDHDSIMFLLKPYTSEKLLKTIDMLLHRG